MKAYFLGMKVGTAAAALALVLGGGVHGAEQMTAWSALELARSSVALDLRVSLVELEGRKGQPQPESWRIVVRDAESRTGLRRFEVRSKGVSDAGEETEFYPERLPSGMIRAEWLLTDSTDAFQVLNGEALKAGVGFDSCDFRLEGNRFLRDAIWLLTARDGRDRPVGQVEIAASSGEVLRSVWYRVDSRFSNELRVQDSVLQAPVVPDFTGNPLYAPPTVPMLPERAVMSADDVILGVDAAPGQSYGVPVVEVAPADPEPAMVEPPVGQRFIVPGEAADRAILPPSGGPVPSGGSVPSGGTAMPPAGGGVAFPPADGAIMAPASDAILPPGVPQDVEARTRPGTVVEDPESEAVRVERVPLAE